MKARHLQMKIYGYNNLSYNEKWFFKKGSHYYNLLQNLISKNRALSAMEEDAASCCSWLTSLYFCHYLRMSVVCTLRIIKAKNKQYTIHLLSTERYLYMNRSILGRGVFTRGREYRVLLTKYQSYEILSWMEYTNISYIKR